MSLALNPDLPAVLHAAASAALTAHVAAASLALAAGITAAAARKGGRLHRRSGDVFVAAMLVMSTMAVPVALYTSGGIGPFAGLFPIYLTLTAWAAGRGSPGTVSRVELCAFAMAVVMAAYLVLQLSLALALFAALMAAQDYRMIRRGGLVGRARTARHVWRICAAFFVATGSFFIGQQQVMPKFIQGSPILFLLGLAPLGLMAFWLVRIRAGRASRQPPVPAVG